MKSKIAMILLAASLWGCSEFLKETSQSEIRPSTVRDMEKLLEGEAYFSPEEGYLFNRATEIFTDDVQSNQLNDESSYTVTKEEDRYRFAWDQSMFNESSGRQDITFWQYPYERINRCNLILECIDAMEGDEAEREHLKGEAYTLRGFYYLMLVNFFGMPYGQGDPAQNLGVPLKLDSGVTDDRLSRNTVAECYEQIEQDLLRGTELMRQNVEEQSLQITRLNYLTGCALLSRMYLYMENWENALRYADTVLAARSELLDLRATTTSCVYYTNSPEVIWAGVETYSGYSTGEMYPYTPSMDLAAVYSLDVDGGVTDIRGDYNNVSADAFEITLTPIYLKRGRWWNTESYVYEYWLAAILKSSTVSVGGNFYNGGVRVAELYLNRAEVLARRYAETGNVEDGDAALETLNALRRHRFEAGYVDKRLSDFASGQELLDFCLRERRRELCAESNHRWFDIRRLGLSVNHVYVDNNGYQTTFTLQSGDPRYALPIPEEVIRRNSNLIQN